MSAIEIAIVIALGSLAYALFACVRQERQHRGKWTAPPLLIRIAAVGCAWIGQGIIVLMLIPSVFLRRGRIFLGGESLPGVRTELGLATLVFGLGPLLLARHRGVNLAVGYATTLLRYWAGALLLFSLLGLNTGRGPVFWWSVLCFGALCGLLAVVLMLAIRAHASLFPSDATLDGEAQRSQ
jgi:hypothetical protein